jgi:hypothetical protein
MCGKKRWKEKYFLSQLCGSCAFHKAHPECIRKVPLKVGINTSRPEDICNNKDPYHQRFDWDDLRELYIVKNLSAYAISEIKHCKASAVYKALRRKDIPVRSLKESRNLRLLRGEASSNYKGGRLSYGGYISILKRDHPYCSKLGYVAEHRLVIEKEIGRYLTKQEHVHHKNHIKYDNRIENLEILSPSNHIIREQVCVNCPLYKSSQSVQLDKDELIDIRCA